MLLLEFITWWYGTGWQQMARTVKLKVRGVSQVFSVGILLRTLFAPWRRVVTPPGAGLDAHMAAFRDNLIGRFVGFSVRITVLLCAGIITVFVVVGGALFCIVWPVLPAVAVAALVWGAVR